MTSHVNSDLTYARLRGVVVSNGDFESPDLGSIPGATSVGDP